jgi:pimeloyl-ACP methyl ester carboxylesterase
MLQTLLRRAQLRPYALLLFVTLFTLTGCTIPEVRPESTPPATEAAYLEEEVTFAHTAGGEEITLAGTLTLPDAPGPHPAVILISGSGQQDRDEAIPFVPDYRPFQVIADHLARQGVAVLRYDDRGVGGSTGDPSLSTSADFALDAEAAIAYLQERPEIDPAQIGLFGHSEGALIAAMIAARNPDVAFVISMAGPAVSGYDLLLLQSERVLAGLEMNAEEQAAALVEQQQVMDLVVAEDWEALEALLWETGRKQIEALPEAQRAALGDIDTFLAQQIALSMQNMQGWMRYFLVYNPADDWAQVDVPVLALFGGLDVQVDTAQNRPALEAALAEAGNDDVTVESFANANHLFQQAITGSPNEYATLPPDFVPGFLTTISDWLLARVDVQTN